MLINHGLIHCIAHCQDCDWQEEGHKIAVREARKHHKKTGYTIDIESGNWKQYKK